MEYAPDETLIDAEVDAPSTLQRLLSRRGALLFGTIASLVAVDIAHDANEGAELEHLLIEAGLMGVALWGGVTFYRYWQRERAFARRALGEARRDSRRWQAEAETWRAEAKEILNGLGVAIERQFERWRLSPAEGEVALLLLKGLSLKEVASVRGTSERTTRKQARSVYQKASLAGRAELSAFFLEDLLPAAPEAGSG